jgi:hypothetical protein
VILAVCTVIAVAAGIGLAFLICAGIRLGDEQLAHADAMPSRGPLPLDATQPFPRIVDGAL